LLHTYSQKDVRDVAELAKRFGDTKFIMGHMGGTDDSGTGGNWKQAITAAYEFSNIYLEVCMTRLEAGKIEETVEKIGSQQVLYGSDMTLLNLWQVRISRCDVVHVCPRKSPEGKVAKWAYTMYKQKRKKVAHGPYNCPVCAKNTLNILIDKKNKRVIASCICGIKRSLDYSPIFETIDYYNKLVRSIDSHPHATVMEAQ